MSTIKVITSNNVEIAYEVAGIGDRALATLIDWLVMFAYGYLVFQLLDSLNLTLRMASSTAIILFYLPIFLYHLFFELMLDGQSIGKKTLGIRVVMLDASRPAFVNYFLRWIITPLEFGLGGFGVVPMIAVAISGKGQRLADLASGTTVIRLKAKAGMNAQLFHADDAKVKEYKVTFQEVMHLSDHDLNLLRMIQIQLRRKSMEEAVYFAEETKEVICHRLQIQTKMPGSQFIDTLLQDYYYLANQMA